jgi:hypothetical protein
MAISNTAANIRLLEGAIGRDYEAAGAINVGDAVYVNSSGKILKAQANAAATALAVGVLAASFDGDASIASGERGTVCVFGPVGGYAGLIEGSPAYLSDATAGGLLDAEPTGAGKWSHVVGYGEQDGVLFVLPGMKKPQSQS